jgi:diguanylate cyclase (GGDEF)-like protein
MEPKSSRHGKMSARWNRAFAVLLFLGLATAVLSLVVVQQVESTFTAATNEVTRETAMYDRLVGSLIAENAAAHVVLDHGSAGSEDFLGLDKAAESAFADAASTYNSAAERALVAQAHAQWVDDFGLVRTLAADDVAANAFASGPDGDDVHLLLGEKAEVTSATLQQLDQSSRGALRERIDQAHATKSKLLVLLGAIFTLSVLATIMYAGRMAHRVVRPIRILRESADRFGAGELDHRVELHNDDEIGELAERFNVMADTIASTHRHLTVQAHHDALTGLVNRAGFVGRLDAAVDPAGPDAGSISLMFIDLDDFKHVNDDLGHAAGDELLRQVADRLRGAARSTDVVCRLGGDEFAVLLGGHNAGGTIAVGMAERVLGVLEQPFSIHGALIRVGASIGIATQASVTDTGDHLLRAADVAMYSAKGQGKHRWQMFDPLVHGPISDDVSSILARLAAGDLDLTDLSDHETKAVQP